MSRRRDRARALEPGDVARESRGVREIFGAAETNASRRAGTRAIPDLGSYPSQEVGELVRVRRGELADLPRRLVPRSGRRAGLEQAEKPVEPAAPAFVSHDCGRAPRRLKRKADAFPLRRKKMSRFRANLHSCARGAWRIGPRTAMPMDDTAGRVPPRRVADPTGGASGRGRGAAPGPSRPSRPTPVGSGASSSVPRRRAPSGTLHDRSTSGGQTSVARERAEREKSVASLMTRDKERLAEEVIELKRVNDDVATRLKLAQAEVIRATGELRKRERALEALERGDDDGGAARRATRVLELEAENEVYLSEVARLASLLRLDPETGQLPGTSAGSSPDVPGADDEATPSNETGFRTASSAEVARLRGTCLLYTSPSPRDRTRARMPSSA